MALTLCKRAARAISAQVADPPRLPWGLRPPLRGPRSPSASGATRAAMTATVEARGHRAAAPLDRRLLYAARMPGRITIAVTLAVAASGCHRRAPSVAPAPASVETAAADAPR